MRRNLVILALVGAGSLTVPARQAEANMIYQFTNLAAVYVGPGRVQSPALPFTAMFDLTDAQVQSGSFVLSDMHGDAGDSPAFSGDVDGFNSLMIAGESVRPDYLHGALDMALTFDAAGQIMSSDVLFRGRGNGADVSGMGMAAFGWIGSDNPRCNADMSQRYCWVAGYYSLMGDPVIVAQSAEVSAQLSDAAAAVPVPEPASLALFGAGVLGLVMARRRVA